MVKPTYTDIHKQHTDLNLNLNLDIMIANDVLM